MNQPNSNMFRASGGGGDRSVVRQLMQPVRRPNSPEATLDALDHHVGRYRRSLVGGANPAVKPSRFKGSRRGARPGRILDLDPIRFLDGTRNRPATLHVLHADFRIESLGGWSGHQYKGSAFTGPHTGLFNQAFSDALTLARFGNGQSAQPDTGHVTRQFLRLSRCERF